MSVTHYTPVIIIITPTETSAYNKVGGAMGDSYRTLQLAYVFFLGLLLAMFVGVGINTFYVAPKAPEHTLELNTYRKEPTTEQVEKQRAFDQQVAQHNKAMQPYNRNVSIMALSAAIIFVSVSVVLEKRIKVIANGVLLGGLFTLLYSIGRGFASENSKYVFVVVTAGLAVVIYLGYHRFIKARSTTFKED